ncbi:MAG: septum site-determining protein MinC [Burkholderiales bacterium]|nr:septum site-determining protein MinC [Burkholderiales bacterium]
MNSPTSQVTLTAASAKAAEKSAIGKAYEIKGSMFGLLALRLKCTDVEAIGAQLGKQLETLRDFLGDPLVLDLKNVPGNDGAPDFPTILAMMRELGLTVIGVCNGNEAQHQAAREAGLPALKSGGASSRPTRALKSVSEANLQKDTDAAAEAASEETAQEPSETRAGPQPATELSEETPAPPASTPATVQIVHTPVRTGQRVFAAHGDLTLLAGVNAGAEVMAAGSIHVYGPLRGRALAGLKGDTEARIFTLSMEAELVSIAGCFRVFESALGPDIQGRPAQIYLDGERIVIAPLD